MVNNMNFFAKLISLVGAITLFTVNGATVRIAKEATGAGAPTTSSSVAIPDHRLRIINREEWHARQCSSPGYSPMVVSPAPYVVAHHGGIPHYCYDQETCSRIVRGYQDYHMDTHGWIDVGYHFIIGGDGNVYEGRGWDNVGAHAPGYNTQGIGICIIGDYTSHMPNDASLNAFKQLIEYGVSIGKIKPEYKLIGHRQGRATECPGQTFYRYLKSWPEWESSPVPLFAASAGPSSATLAISRTKLQAGTVGAVPTVDITGTKLWTNLIALGTSRRAEESTTYIAATTEVTVEENVLDTGNNHSKIRSN